MAATVHVVKPGLLTTVQDLGRWGWQERGIPVSGPMDPFSHRLANLLTGNDRGAAALEITLIGPEIGFDGDCVVAVAGARFALTVDGRAVPMLEPVHVPAGGRLRFGARTAGSRAYLAFAGGIEVPPILGSRATHVPSAMGGYKGRALAAGDRLPIGAARSRPPRPRTPLAVPPDDNRLRVLPGPQHDRFVAAALDALQSAPYALEQDSDRMGYRLSGPPLVHRNAADIISDPTPFGALQVPASRLPLLLMADRPTTGGYAKIATVISADLPVAGQLGPGDSVRFEVCTPAAALSALIAQERQLLALEGGA